MWKIAARKIGWLFCEIAFRWFDFFNYPLEDYKWRWYHYMSYLLGSIPMVIGCFFYGIAGEKRDE